VIAQVRELAQSHSEEPIETLVAIMRDESKPTAARVAAAVAVLDCGYGKPSQEIAVQTQHVDPRKLTDEELEALIIGGRSDAELAAIFKTGRQRKAELAAAGVDVEELTRQEPARHLQWRSA
jgi:hypothetical protein